MRRAPLTIALLMLGCDAPSPPPRRRRDAETRPVFPSSAGLREVRLDCFPAGFVVSRARVTGGAVELCGQVPGASTACFLVDPGTSEVRRSDRSPGALPLRQAPELQAPLTRGSLSLRDARASLVGGALTTIGGRTQTAQARQLGFSSIENAAIVPWQGGWFVGVVGVRAPDLGASALVDPSTGRAVGRAPVEPCRDGGV